MIFRDRFIRSVGDSISLLRYAFFLAFKNSTTVNDPIRTGEASEASQTNQP